MYRFIIAAASASLALTPAAAQAPAAMTATARQIIAQRMVDPNSLQLRNTRIVKITSPQGKQVELLCGEYNAKNRMGGFTGYTTFAYEPAEMGGVLSLALPRRMDFFSNDGKTDMGDPTAMIRDGLPGVEVDRRIERQRIYALQYAPPCFGFS